MSAVLGGVHTSAKLIEIQQKSLQRRHGLHEPGGQMESNDTLRRSGVTAHWILRPKMLKFGPMGPKKISKSCSHEVTKVPYGCFVQFKRQGSFLG